MSAKRPRAGNLSSEQLFRSRCAAYLDMRWNSIQDAFAETAPDMPPVPLAESHELVQYIRDSLTSSIVTYHYVLPTQVLAKCVDQQLDARCVQVSSGLIEAFDARSLAHDVLVPFDQENSNVLGGSSAPYINNPLRVPGVLAEYRGNQKKKADWDKLVHVLDVVQNSPDTDLAALVFDQILYEIHRLLDATLVEYPTPNRISLSRTINLIDRFVAEKSGGDRIEAVVAALFRTIGRMFGVFTEVRRGKVNSSDRSSRMAADVECYLDGKIVLLIEVKDQSLTLVQLNAKLDSARVNQIQEILFIAQHGKDPKELSEIDSMIASEFTSGQNVYVENLRDFSLGILVLLGEKGRVEFLREIGAELSRANSALKHKKAWANLLKRA